MKSDYSSVGQLVVYFIFLTMEKTTVSISGFSHFVEINVYMQILKILHKDPLIVDNEKNLQKLSLLEIFLEK